MIIKDGTSLNTNARTDAWVLDIRRTELSDSLTA